jgi:hypothetical protein
VCVCVYYAVQAASLYIRGSPRDHWHFFNCQCARAGTVLPACETAPCKIKLAKAIFFGLNLSFVLFLFFGKHILI